MASSTIRHSTEIRTLEAHPAIVVLLAKGKLKHRQPSRVQGEFFYRAKVLYHFISLFSTGRPHTLSNGIMRNQNI